MTRAAVLSAYKELLRLITRLPDGEKISALREARDGMRLNRSASEEHVADLLRVLISKIGFLRMKVPKRPRDAGALGYGTYVVRDGKVVEGKACKGTRCVDGHVNFLLRNSDLPRMGVILVVLPQVTSTALHVEIVETFTQ
jgi:hypothetical protein